MEKLGGYRALKSNQLLAQHSQTPAKTVFDGSLTETSETMTKNDDLGALINNGFHELNWPPRKLEEPRTIVVVGLARSGTTMTAQALKELGVDMGSTNVVLENGELARLVERGDPKGFKQKINELNAQNEVWGFKRPMAYRYAKTLENAFRNPHFIFIFRDIFAIAMRNKISMQDDVLAVVSKARKRKLGTCRRNQIA